MMFSFFIVQETLYLYDKKRSARMRTRRKGRWLLMQPSADVKILRSRSPGGGVYRENRAHGDGQVKKNAI